MSNVSIDLKKQEREKIKQQERLLIDLAKEFRKLLSESEKTECELKQYLNQNDAFITGVKHGFGNIKLRELADIFTFFNKKVLLKPVEIDKKYQIIQFENNISLYKMKRPKNMNKDIESIILIGVNDKLEHKEQAVICFDKNNENILLETSKIIEDSFSTTYSTVFKSKIGVENGR